MVLKREGQNLQLFRLNRRPPRAGFAISVSNSPRADDIMAVKLFASNRNGAEPLDVLIKRLFDPGRSDQRPGNDGPDRLR